MLIGYRNLDANHDCIMIATNHPYSPLTHTSHHTPETSSADECEEISSALNTTSAHVECRLSMGLKGGMEGRLTDLMISDV